MGRRLRTHSAGEPGTGQRRRGRAAALCGRAPRPAGSTGGARRAQGCDLRDLMCDLGSRSGCDLCWRTPIYAGCCGGSCGAAKARACGCRPPDRGERPLPAAGSSRGRTCRGYARAARVPRPGSAAGGWPRARSLDCGGLTTLISNLWRCSFPPAKPPTLMRGPWLRPPRRRDGAATTAGPRNPGPPCGPAISAADSDCFRANRRAPSPISCRCFSGTDVLVEGGFLPQAACRGPAPAGGGRVQRRRPREAEAGFPAGRTRRAGL